MRVLITGGAGVLGRQLAEVFINNGEKARIFDLPQVDYSYFDDKHGIEIVKGDLRNKDTVKKAVEGVDTILHLAALIPPASERNREFTMAINVGGTENLLEAAHGSGVHFILTSSVATYGDTTGDEPPVKVSHPQTAIDIYAESKIESERLTIASGLPYTIFRIAPISVPEIMDPPEVWCYMARQRVEFVHRDDVADALFACIYSLGARNKILNIAGGSSWQMTGREYVTALYEAMDLEPGGACFSESPSWFDWYDTEQSQAILQYQNTPFFEFVVQLRRAAEEAFAW